MILNVINMMHKLVQYPVALSCPKCSYSFFIRCGKVKGIQRYRCKNCGTYFRDTTDTPLHHLHKKEKVSRYLKAMQKGMSVRKAASYAGISKNTAFIWRHKFLSSLSRKPLPAEQNAKAGAVVIQLPYSAKGRKKPPEKNTKQTKSLLIISRTDVLIKKISSRKCTFSSSQILDSAIKNGCLATVPDRLLSSSMKKQTKIRPFQNPVLKMKYTELARDGLIQINNWMQRFRGVASKYLQYYWEWYVSLQRAEKLVSGDNEFSNWCVENRSLSGFKRVKST